MPTPHDTAKKKKPGRSAETEAREAERRERLAAALRENLRKRKMADRPKRSDAPASGADEE